VRRSGPCARNSPRCIENNEKEGKVLVNVKDILDDLRSRTGETHAQAADRLGIPIRTYRSWISAGGGRHVRVQTCATIARAYDVPESVVRLAVGALPIWPHMWSAGAGGALADGWRRLFLLQAAEHASATEDEQDDAQDVLNLLITEECEGDEDAGTDTEPDEDPRHNPDAALWLLPLSGYEEGR